MKKILFAVDCDPTDEDAVDFACHLARLTSSRVDGIFLNEPVMEEVVVIGSRTGRSGLGTTALTESDKESEQAAQRVENIQLFREHASQTGVPFTVHLDKGIPAGELAKESFYADLLVMSPDTFSKGDEVIPSEFVRNILHDAACPVVLAPGSFEQIGNVVFCYDGSKSSIYAIKQFSYLFPQLGSQRVKIVSLKAEGPKPEEQSRLTEWLRSQYSDVEWIARGPEAAEALFHYLLKKHDDFVVMGPYGHGLLSSFFEPDCETGALLFPNLPIFITHC